MVTVNSKESLDPSSLSQATWTLKFKFVYTLLLDTLSTADYI